MTTNYYENVLRVALGLPPLDQPLSIDPIFQQTWYQGSAVQASEAGNEAAAASVSFTHDSESGDTLDWHDAKAYLQANPGKLVTEALNEDTKEYCITHSIKPCYWRYTESDGFEFQISGGNWVYSSDFSSDDPPDNDMRYLVVRDA